MRRRIAAGEQGATLRSERPKAEVTVRRNVKDRVA